MCLIALVHRVWNGCPLAVAANREEFFDRPGLRPAVLLAGPSGLRAMYGRDSRAGGTWLGVNERGLLVAVTNFWFVEPPLAPRSRGALALDLLNCTSATEAALLAERELAAGRYAGVNYLCADADDAVVVSNGPTRTTTPLEPGLHVLTNGPIDDPNDVRQQFFRQLYSKAPPAGPDEFVTNMRAILSQGTGVYGDATIVLKAADRGTVSSSIILLPRDRAGSQWHFAPQAPDRVAHVDMSSELRALFADQAAGR